MDYNYFRGVDDHQPIFLSRYLHLLFLWLAGLTICWTLFRTYGRSSVPLLAMFFGMWSAPEIWSEGSKSLPNAINAVFAFGVVAFAISYCDRGKRALLLGSVACLAMGLNFKIDMALLTPGPAIAILFSAGRFGVRTVLRDAAVALVLFIAVFIATSPAILVDPVQNLLVHYPGHFPWLNRQNAPDFRANVRSLLQFVGQNITFTTMWWKIIGVIAGLLAIGVLEVLAFSRQGLTHRTDTGDGRARASRMGWVHPVVSGHLSQVLVQWARCPCCGIGHGNSGDVQSWGTVAVVRRCSRFSRAAAIGWPCDG